MAQTKEQILNKVTEICNKGNFNFTAVSIDKLCDGYVKRFDVENVKEDDVYSSIKNELESSYKLMSSKLAEETQKLNTEKSELEKQLSELQKQNKPTQPQTQTQTTTTQQQPQTQEKPDVAEALKSLGLDAEELKKLIESKKSNEENERIVQHTKDVFENALKNVPEKLKDDFKRFSIGRTFSGKLESDVVKLNNDFKESIKDLEDIDIETGGGSADENSKYSEVNAAIQRNLKKNGKVTNN